MARKKRNNFALGVTVIVMFAAIVAVLLFIGGESFSAEARRTIVIRFEPGGLMPELSDGSLVMALGQKVGKITGAAIVESEATGGGGSQKKQFLEVRASVRENLDLRTDCEIVASGPPLGGKGMLEIIHRGKSAARLTDEDFVIGKVSGFQPALDMITRELDVTNPDGLLTLIKYQLDPRQRESLVARIHKSLADINVMTERLAAETDGATQGRLLAKIHEGMNRINESLGALESLIVDNRGKIDNTLSSVEHATSVADTRILESLAGELDAHSPASLIARAHGSIEALNKALADLNVITDTGKRVVVLNADRIDELIQYANEASMTLKFGLKDFWRHPWKIFAKPSASEQHKLNVQNAARDFVEAAAHLDDATSRLKALVDASGGQVASSDPELARIRSDLTETIDRFSEVENALWEALVSEGK